MKFTNNNNQSILTQITKNYQKLLTQITRQHQTLKDTIRHHQPPTDSSKLHSMSTWTAPPHNLFWLSGNICWCSLVPVGVCCYSKLSWDIWKWCQRTWVKCLWGSGMRQRCIGVSRPYIVQQMQMLRKEKFHTSDTFETYQNTFISSVKIIGLLHVVIFWVCKKITIYCLFWPSCMWCVLCSSKIIISRC